MLDDAYGKSARQAASILHDIGYGASSIATALKNAYSTAASTIADILHDLGYSASRVISVLDDVYDLAQSSIESALAAAGYGFVEAFAAIVAFFGSVTDAFCEFFRC